MKSRVLCFVIGVFLCGQVGWVQTEGVKLTLKGERWPVGRPWIDKVVVSGEYAYCAVRLDGLMVFDAGNPASPQLMGVINTSGDAHDVAVSGDYAYVADGTAGLQVIDVRNRASFRVRRRCPCGAWPPEGEGPTIRSYPLAEDR